MLDKNDLKQIQTIVQTVTKKILVEETGKIVAEETKKVVIAETKKILHDELKPIKEDISQIRKDTKTIVNFFDKEYLELRKRDERIENHLNLSTLS